MRCSATTVLPVPGPPSTTSAPREPARTMASWSDWMVPSTSRIRSRAAAAEGGDEGGLVVERGRVGEPLLGEGLVPVVDDPAVGPAVATAADEALRLRVRGGEERLGGGRAPVDQQAAPVGVGEAEAADVRRLGAVVVDDPAEAEVEVEAAQGTQAGGQPVHLLVALEGGGAVARGALPRLGEAVLEVGDRVLEAGRDRGEVGAVGVDEDGVVLGGQGVGKGEGMGVR